jgi:protein-S-isoprenylcysteine O-methyltransferase Ste14
MEKTVATSAAPDRSTKVLVFPPVIPATGFLLGVALEKLAPLGHMLVGVPLPLVRAVGGAVIAIGIAGFAWMIATMKRARTPIHNARNPTTLVEHGPFRYTRNPMYVFGSTWYAGLAIALVQPWSLALLPVTFAVMHHGVVLREEASLERRFGERYRRYKARVPRYW